MVKNLIKDTNTFDITKTPSYEKALEEARTRFPGLTEEGLHQMVQMVITRGQSANLNYDPGSVKLPPINPTEDTEDLERQKYAALIRKNAFSGLPMHTTDLDEELSAFELELLTRTALIYQNSLFDLPTIPVKLTKSLYSDPSRPRMFAKELNKEKHFTPTKDGVKLGDSFPQFPLCELQKNITDWVQQAREDVK